MTGVGQPKKPAGMQSIPECAVVLHHQVMLVCSDLNIYGDVSRSCV